MSTGGDRAGHEGRRGLYQRSEDGFGHGGGTVALTAAPGHGAAGFGRTPFTPTAPFTPARFAPRPADFGRAAPADTPAGRVARIADRLRHIDLVVDLGARIGSLAWWRGLFTCTALCGGAMALAPSVPALDVPVAAPLAPAQYDETRTIGFAPLAYGADSGKRMAATDAVEPLTDTPERPTLDLVATLGIGDGFTRVLERAGIAAHEAQDVAALVSAVQPLGDIAPGTRIAITLGRRPAPNAARPLDRLDFRARFDLALGLARTNGVLRLAPRPIAVDATPLRIQGIAGASLYRAARAAGAPADAVEAYLKALATRMPVGDIAGDDRFDLVLEHRRAATGESETGRLLYAGLAHGTRETRLLRWAEGGRDTWYEASGAGERRGVMTRPVMGRETSGFGLRRHPILGYTRFHRGIDFAAPYGSPILAAADGRVVFAGWHGGHGNYVMLDNGGAIRTGYGHMSRILARPGSIVQQGQVIGYVGSTGLSTGPHLHYEVYRNGIAIDPAGFAFTSTAQLAGDALVRFRATLARLMALRPGAPVQPATGMPRG